MEIMMPFNTTRTDLVCLNCGNVTSIQRKSNKQKKISHIKDLWCYKCLQITKHYEVRDIDKFILNFNFVLSSPN